jgi:hypothetical protein
MKRLLPLAGLLLLLAPAGFVATGEPPAAPEDRPPRPQPVTPPAPEAIEDAIRRGVAFLLKDQNRDGSWGTPERTKDLNIYAPVPDAHLAFRSGVTGLCVSALIEVGGDSEQVRKSLERGEAWILENLPQLRRADATALYNVWGHLYCIQALVRMHERLPKDEARRRKIADLIHNQIGFLGRYESVDGGWGYYDFRAGTQRPSSDSTSFVNAAALVALYEAKQIGISVPDKMVKRAVDATLRMCKPDFSYIYGEYLKYRPMMPVNRPGGSLGRSQSCNVALRLWGEKRITDDVIIAWLDRLFARNGWLDMGRKRPIPHESYFQVAGYFFYFGHYYAALCIGQIPADRRAGYQDQLAHVLLPLQEKDGSWWDYPLYNYHQQYGTAFALLSLKCCRKPAPVPKQTGG